jgi:hypothetical membrane protein
MKFKGLLRDISGGLFVTSMLTAALVGIFFGVEDRGSPICAVRFF